MPKTQNFSNHVRWYTPVHFIVTPILFINLVWRIVQMSGELTIDTANNFVLAIGLMVLSLAARIQALRAQDRVIRLEERLRYKTLLEPNLLERTEGLTKGQIIALRFASDAELPQMIERTLAGDLGSTKEIKMAVKNWRADHLRV